MSQAVYPHLEYITIEGMVYEAAIMKRDEHDTLFIRIDHLDDIDRSRMSTILMSRNAVRYALWDLLDQTVLPNGVNALEYFHQYVMGLTADGKLFKPSLGRRGAATTAQQQVAAAHAAQVAAHQAAAAAAAEVQAAQAPAEKKSKKE
jgi:GTP1/Obg family GTP-binding protein